MPELHAALSTPHARSLPAQPRGPLPACESERLAVLRAYHVLDTPPEQAFDDLVATAAALTGAPVALVSLVDAERQWFKARTGVPVSEGPRELSFCAHVVAEDREIIACDTREDPRFASSLLVTADPGIRFYAGFPLRGEGGFVLGTLCVADFTPRTLPPEHLMVLRTLSAQAVSLLELRRLLARHEHVASSAHPSSPTGLPARAQLISLLRTLSDPTAEASSAALVVLDLDGFRELNDTFGYEVGDAVLAELALRLERLTLSGHLASLGGGTFALALLGPHPADRAAEALEALPHLVSDAVLVDGLAHRLTASAGAAILHPGDDPLRVLLRAEAASHAHKRTRRARPDLPSHSFSRDLPALDLPQMLIEGRLGLAYQPIVDLRAGRITGVEALIRPLDASRVPISPDRLVEEAEATGEIHLLTRFVLEAAARDISRLRATLPAASELTLGVNLSPLQLEDPSLPADVRAILARTGLPPEAVVFELTEGCLVTNSHTSLRILHELRQLGADLAVDDFGTGFASVSYLRTFPFTVLKLDRSLTVALADPGRAGGLARGVYRLADALDLRVVAEGVENAAQQAAVCAEGCALVQGFRFSRALPLSALELLLADQRLIHARCA